MFEVLDEVLDDAANEFGSYFSVRDLYYSVRDRYLSHPLRPADNDGLQYHYFSTKLLTQYQESRGRIEGLVRDPRGHLYEPHTDTELELGTLSVAGYEFPSFVFDKLLYVEKEGEMPKLRDARLAEKYDMAIVTGKGYPTEAIRALCSRADEGDYQLFVFHDADPDGYGIARALREETRRMPGYSVEVVDLGLTVADAEEISASGEEFIRNKGLDSWLEPLLSGREEELFVGEQLSPKSWRCRRYEINGVRPVSARIAYIEAKLRQNGVRPKVMPPTNHLRDELAVRRDDDIGLWVSVAIDEVVDRHSLVDEMTRRFRSAYEIEEPRFWVEERLEDDRCASWRGVLGGHVDRVGWEVRDEIKAAVGRSLTDAEGGTSESDLEKGGNA